MRIAEIMTRDVRSIEPTESVADAAHLMGELDVGVLPVEDDGKLVGIVTDRDIAIRGVAGGLHGGSPVFRIMTDEVISCREDDDLAEVLATMGRQQVRRIPVCSETGTLIGMIALGDAARGDKDRDEIAETLSDISQPHGRHSQSPHPASIRTG